MAQKMNNNRWHGNGSLYFFERVSASQLDEKTYMLDRMLFIKIMRGSAKIEINGKEYNLTTQNFIFLPPHSCIHLLKSSYDMEANVLGFIMALQDAVFQRLGHAFFSYIFRQMVWQVSDEGNKTLNAFCLLFESLCKNPADSYTSDIANSLCSAFLIAFYRNVKDRFEGKPTEATVNAKSLAGRFAMLLRENFKQEHSVAFYADKLCISSKYLTQVIKENTGFTPKGAIDRTLAVEALFMLGNTSNNIQEISNILGFPDQSYFGRFFKRMFGISPLHYRMNPNLELLKKLKEGVGYSLD